MVTAGTHSRSHGSLEDRTSSICVTYSVMGMLSTSCQEHWQQACAAGHDFW